MGEPVGKSVPKAVSNWFPWLVFSSSVPSLIEPHDARASMWSNKHAGEQGACGLASNWRHLALGSASAGEWLPAAKQDGRSGSGREVLT